MNSVDAHLAHVAFDLRKTAEHLDHLASSENAWNLQEIMIRKVQLQEQYGAICSWDVDLDACAELYSDLVECTTQIDILEKYDSHLSAFCTSENIDIHILEMLGASIESHRSVFAEYFSCKQKYRSKEIFSYEDYVEVHSFGQQDCLLEEAFDFIFRFAGFD